MTGQLVIRNKHTVSQNGIRACIYDVVFVDGETERFYGSFRKFGTVHTKKALINHAIQTRSTIDRRC